MSLTPPASQVELIQLSEGDIVPLSDILAHLLFSGLIENINDPNSFSLTMEAINTQATLSVPVLQGPQGPPGPTSISLKFQNRILNGPDQLPTDLGDTNVDLGKYWVFRIYDDHTGDPIATTIYVWMGTATGWVQLPVGSPGPVGPYANLEGASLDLVEVGSGGGPGDQDSYVAVDDTDPTHPDLGFKLAVDAGLRGPSQPLGGLINVDFVTRKPQVGDVFTKSDRVTPGVPSGVAVSGSSSGGALAAGTWYYGVTATLPNGETAVSTTASVTVSGSSSSAMVTWSAPSGSCTGYRVYRGASTAVDQLVAVISSPDQLSFKDVGLPFASVSPPSPGVASGLPIWVAAPQEPSIPLLYTVPQAAFTSAFGIEYEQSQPMVCKYPVPPQPFPWVPLVFGELIVSGINISLTPLLVGAHVNLGSQGGQLLASGSAGSGGTITMMPNTANLAVTPETNSVIVPANHTGNQGTLYVTLTNIGLAGVYDFNSDNANLSVLVVPIDAGIT